MLARERISRSRDASSNAQSAFLPARRSVRDVNEDVRDVARAPAKTAAFEQSYRQRERIKMLFAYLKRIRRFGRL